MAQHGIAQRRAAIAGIGPIAAQFKLRLAAIGHYDGLTARLDLSKKLQRLALNCDLEIRSSTDPIPIT